MRRTSLLRHSGVATPTSTLRRWRSRHAVSSKWNGPRPNRARRRPAETRFPIPRTCLLLRARSGSSPSVRIWDAGKPCEDVAAGADGSSPTPAYSKLQSSREFRFSDASTPDPQGGWSYHLAGFDIFGALGSFGAWTSPIGVERIAGAPTIKVRGFDNSPSGGGAATPSPPSDPTAWLGGTLTVLVGWSGGVRLMYPDIRTARVTVEAVDIKGNVGQTLATQDLPVPPPSVSALTVSSVALSQQDPTTWQADVSTTPALPQLRDSDPSVALILYRKEGSSERFVVRPVIPSPGADPVARFTLGASAALVAAQGDFEGQPAYLVSGFAATVSLQVPLEIPLGQTTARAQVSVRGSNRIRSWPANKSPIPMEITRANPGFSPSQR